ncbi:MAG: oligosaccharide flippase family protein [Anaerolineae bacterium]|nr:oligosaccharide flippase family protein [Anaerolineae bacterium]
MITIRTLGKNSIGYALGTFFYYSVTILLVPIYTSVLSVSEYGALETLTVINQTLLILIGLGLSNALLRFYSESKNEAEAHEIVRSSSVFILALSLVFFSVLLPFFRPISQALLGNETYAIFVALALIWAAGGVLNELFFAYHRARHDAKTYVLITFCLFIFRLFLNILMIYIVKWGLLGILLGNIISVWMINAWSSFRFWTHGLTISLHWLKVLLGFGLPLVVTRFSWLILNSADRYFLAYYRDLSEVGIYSLGYKAGLIIMIIVIVPFQMAWGPFVFSRFASDREEAKKDFSRVFTYLVSVLSFASLGLFLFAPEIVSFLGAGKFDDAIFVMPFVLFAYFFNAIYYWAGNLFHLEKKTIILSVIAVGMAALNLCLNWIVVPIWGWWGAATVTIITVGGMGLITLLLSRRICPVNLESRRLAKIMVVMFLLVVSYYLLPLSSAVVSWIVRGVVLAIFPILLFVFGFFAPSELDFGRSLISKGRRKFISLIVKPT